MFSGLKKLPSGCQESNSFAKCHRDNGNQLNPYASAIIQHIKNESTSI
jgi:hypothetical protein